MEANNSSKNSLALDSLKFYTSYKNPFKPIGRSFLTKNINNVLSLVKKNSKRSESRILTSHSFRINMISRIIEFYGYTYAQKFAHHSDIETTALYDRNVFDTRMTRKITGILADTRSGKKHKAKNNRDLFEEEANDILGDTD